MVNDTEAAMRWLKRIAAAIAALTILAAAVTTLDNRFAKADDLRQVQRRFDTFELKQEKFALEQRLFALRKSKFEIEVAAQLRKLTVLELQQGEQVKQDLFDTENRLTRVEGELARQYRP